MTSFRNILGQIETLKKVKFHIGKIAEIQDFQIWPKIYLELVIFSFWKSYQTIRKSSAPFSQKDKSMASSWEWHAYFS